MHDLNLRSQGLEPLAVIGFSLKFPQEATSAASFWRMLEERRCAMTEWPTDRISLDSFYDGQSEKRGTVNNPLLLLLLFRLSRCLIHDT